MNEPQVTVVIVSYNSRSDLAESLPPLREGVKAGDLRCVVVDNVSRDGTPEYVAEHHPWVDLVLPGANIGFGRGCNEGIRIAKTPYVLLLNPDAVMPPAEILKLLNFARHNSRVGICGPAVREPDGLLQLAGALTTPSKLLLGSRRRTAPVEAQIEVAPGDPPTRTNWVCGSVMLLRRRMLEQIGAFDPRFFLYFEETDLCLRALRAGWEIWAVGEALATHQNAASTSSTGADMYRDVIGAHYFRSRFYYLGKSFGWPAAAAAELGDLARIALADLVARVRGRPGGQLLRRLQFPILRLPERTT